MYPVANLGAFVIVHEVSGSFKKVLENDGFQQTSYNCGRGEVVGITSAGFPTKF